MSEYTYTSSVKGSTIGTHNTKNSYHRSSFYEVLNEVANSHPKIASCVSPQHLAHLGLRAAIGGEYITRYRKYRTIERA